jgi:hypothetical protein
VLEPEKSSATELYGHLKETQVLGIRRHSKKDRKIIYPVTGWIYYIIFDREIKRSDCLKRKETGSTSYSWCIKGH